LRVEHSWDFGSREIVAPISNVGVVAETLTRLSNLALGLVVDLRDTTYLDSSAISLLHDLSIRLTHRTQSLVIVCDSQSLPRRVLTLTGLDTRAPVVDDVGTAVRLVSQRAGSVSAS
jgi:anti-anti-sigma factor